MTRLNRNIAIALDMEIPDEPPIEESAALTLIEPHEIIKINNPDLPDMTDAEIRLLEGEKQLDEFIGKGMGIFQELYEELAEIQPDKRNRHMEVTSMVMSNTLDAIKHKTELQIKKKQQRMKEQEFSGKNDNNHQTINANFFGSREDIMKMYQEAKAEAEKSGNR